MKQSHASYQPDGRSPEPLEYTAQVFGAPSRPSPQPRNYNNYNYAPSGSLRSTRSGGAYARQVSGNQVPGGARRGHAFTAEPAFNADYGVSPPPPRAHLQPYVPDSSERRTPDVYSHTDYNYRRTQAPSVPAGPVVTTFPEAEYGPRTSSARVYRPSDYEDGGAGPSNNVRYGRRDSEASSQNGADARMSPRPALGNARLIGRRAARDSIGSALSPGPRPVPSHRVEFGYTSPAMATLAQSPEHDEIADIIADMTKSRISPVNTTEVERPKAHVLLQLHDDVKRVELAEEPSHTLLVNLFIEKYKGRLAEDPEALPEIYIKDVKSGMFYELEDMHDVVDGSVLSWRTRPLSEPKAKPAEDTQSPDHSVAELVKTVAQLAETVAALPTQITGELNTTMKQLQDHTSASLESVSAQVQRSLDTRLQPHTSPMDVDKNSTPLVTRSSSMSVTSNENAEKLRHQLSKAEMDLSVERQKHKDTVTSLQAEKDALTRELDKLRTDVATHPNIHRVRIEEGKAMLKNEYRAQNTLFEDVHGLVQEMRKDVAQRGSIPSAQMMKKASTDLQAITTGTQKLLKFINETRSDWKRTWEEELQNILKEQSFVKDVEQMLGELLDDTKHLDDVRAKLDKIIELKLNERAKSDYVPAAATKFIDVIGPDDAHNAKNDYLKQISCVDVDHSRRLDALKAAERLREQELATKVNEFDDELSDFVGQRKLRKTGGTEELERRRTEKNAEVMKNMLKSVEEADQARRAKISERKKAKKQPKEKTPVSSSKDD
ncbi:Bud site selection protein 6 [Coemansia erecta]|nr:Bud site selection protein 6 [Coemansia erecta]